MLPFESTVAGGNPLKRGRTQYPPFGSPFLGSSYAVCFIEPGISVNVKFANCRS